MRGSQRARDILQAMGADAFKFHTVFRGCGPNAPRKRQRPLSGRQIAHLKKEYILEDKCAVAPYMNPDSLTCPSAVASLSTPGPLCRPWPYEKQSPLRREPVIRDVPPKGHRWERVKVEREKQIAANMAKMPKLIEESKVWHARVSCVHVPRMQMLVALEPIAGRAGGVVLVPHTAPRSCALGPHMTPGALAAGKA